MNRMSFAVGIAALLTLAGGIASLSYISSRQTDQLAKDLLHVPLERLSLGTVWEDESFAWILPVTNTSSKAVEVEGIAASCSCVSLKPKEFVIEPGETINIHLTINLLVKRQEDGSIALALAPRIKSDPTDKTRARIQWKLHGVVKKSLVAERSVDLGKHSDMEGQIKLRNIPIEAVEPLDSLTATCDISDMRPSVQALDTNGKKFLLTLTLPEKSSAHDLEGKVFLSPICKDGKKLPSCIVRLHGKIVPDPIMETSELLIGGVVQGETTEEIVSVRSLTGRKFAIDEVSVIGDGLTAEAIMPGRVRVRQVASKIGLQYNTVRLAVSVEGRKVNLEVPVTYTGLVKTDR